MQTPHKHLKPTARHLWCWLASQLTEEGPCAEWPWPVPNYRGRRPTVTIGGSCHKVSRWVWILAHGDPGPAMVTHACHNAGCGRLAHLRLGDATTNRWDHLDNCVQNGTTLSGST